MAIIRIDQETSTKFIRGIENNSRYALVNNECGRASDPFNIILLNTSGGQLVVRLDEGIDSGVARTIIGDVRDNYQKTIEPIPGFQDIIPLPNVDEIVIGGLEVGTKSTSIYYPTGVNLAMLGVLDAILAQFDENLNDSTT